MTIRIDSLPLDGSNPAIEFSKVNCFSHIQPDEPPEIAYLYGGTVTSDPVMPQVPIHSAASSLEQSSPAEKWSAALQNVLDRPPPSLPDRLVVGGVIFCAAFGAWATTSQIEEVGRAQGRLIPQGDTYKVHPAVSGKIARLYVQEGQAVKAGQVIAQLENEIALNRVEALRQEQFSYEKELLQTENLIDKTRSEAQTRLTISDAEIRAHTATIAQVQAKLQGGDTAIAQVKEKANINQAVLAQLQEDASNQQERLTRWKYLVDQGALARDQLFQAQQQFGERQRTITQQAGEIQQTIAESQKMRSDLQQIVAESQQLRARLAQKYAEGQNAQLQAQQAIQQLLVQRTQVIAKMQQSEKLLQQASSELNQLTLKAPVDGIVSALNIHNRGEVVQSGQTITEIAPKTAPLILIAALPTREAGFVKVGDKVQIKFDAYPYQDYGIFEGKVVSMSPDVKLDERIGAVYRVEISLDRHSISTPAQRIELKAGQTATAEIIVRRRTISEMLLEPIRQLQKGGLSL
ncbi:HlyD family type I secretion periplasmic adaptor subunit [Leptolyngbya sp. AN03gr2]|uniref:HlyD family type I secretion periplasmic adaptor subunit n=1 Tax=unclassified Leptolyngbya TaxID=2650499 RepID=UPI003D323B1F